MAVEATIDLVSFQYYQKKVGLVDIVLPLETEIRNLVLTHLPLHIFFFFSFSLYIYLSMEFIEVLFKKCS